jgi:hypothetical protein
LLPSLSSLKVKGGKCKNPIDRIYYMVVFCKQIGGFLEPASTIGRAQKGNTFSEGTIDRKPESGSESRDFLVKRVPERRFWYKKVKENRPH